MAAFDFGNRNFFGRFGFAVGGEKEENIPSRRGCPSGRERNMKKRDYMERREEKNTEKQTIDLPQENVCDFEVMKIVGASSDKNWPQVHAFSPREPEKAEKFGNLVVVFRLTSKEESLEISSFGKEVIQRFHEIYYSSLEESVLDNLKFALEKISGEFDQQIDLEVSAVVIIGEEKPILYASCFNCRVKIYRNSSLVELAGSEGEVESVSGWLQPDDRLILGTKQFFEQISDDLIKSSLQKEDLDLLKEELSAIVGSEKDNSQTAAAVVVFKKRFEGLEAAESEVPEETKENFLKKIKKLFPKFSLPAPQKVEVFLKKRVQGKSKKTQLTAAIILILLLLVSVAFGFRKRIADTRAQKETQVLREAEDLYQQALSTAQASPARAGELLGEAAGVLENYQQELEEQSLPAGQLAEKIGQSMEEISKEYKQDEAEIFLDLELAKKGFSGSDLGVYEKKVIILDSSKNVVLLVDLETKEAEIAAGGDELENAEKAGLTENFIFVLSKNKLLMVGRESGELIDTKEVKELGKIKDINGFSNNAYLLGKEQIYKFVGLDDGLADEKDYLKKEDPQLEDSISLSIDGSVWALAGDGRILKYTRGAADFFAINGLDKPLSRAKIIYTDKDSDNIYILDTGNTRVISVDKENGDYKASYVWSGIAGVSDIAVSEELGKIFLLAGAKIYEMKIRNLAN